MDQQEQQDQQERFCPLFGTHCWGAQCQWWVEGHGLLGDCAIAQLARHHVIASQAPDLLDIGRFDTAIPGKA
jgi:hypothetical protein